MSILTICIFVSSISFLIYGVSYFAGTNMKKEFKRFGLEKLGLLVIVLEIIGALGLLLGFYSDILLLISSGGLGLLMFLGVAVRARLKDSLWITIPALFYMFLNFYIFYIAVKI
jgi:hypothetical protein